MKKRERQITALYGFSLIRDDILKKDYPPKLTATQSVIAFLHYTLDLIAMFILVGSAAGLFIWSSQYL